MITGYSGAGKSEAIAAFEDGGYFCVDNLPPRMIESLGELFRHEGSGVERAAVVTDAIGNKAGAAAAPVLSVGTVREFLAAAERGKAQQRETAAQMRQETREGDGTLYNETRSAGGRWVHKSYLAK